MCAQSKTFCIYSKGSYCATGAYDFVFKVSDEKLNIVHAFIAFGITWCILCKNSNVNTGYSLFLRGTILDLSRKNSQLDHKSFLALLFHAA